MRAKPNTFRTALVAAALFSAAGLGAACAGSRGGSKAPASRASVAHPQVDASSQSCAGCHADATPQIAKEWEAGRHGLSLVRCYVCHGSTGADFRARPDTAGCRSCHSLQAMGGPGAVAGAEPRSDCFTCHAPHALSAKGKTNPHAGLR